MNHDGREVREVLGSVLRMENERFRTDDLLLFNPSSAESLDRGYAITLNRKAMSTYPAAGVFRSCM